MVKSFQIRITLLFMSAMYVLPGHLNNHNDEEAALLLDLFEDEAPIGQRQSSLPAEDK